ncbi:MAG: carbohydrate kinase family protein [Anaerolineaceae bacterium]|nr:carbohydrate kinase family protein [Anaerolineaceae bacterium]
MKRIRSSTENREGMMDEGYVLVIGSAGVDIKGTPLAPLEWGVPNLGRVRNRAGGVARNIAENLARLEIETILITAVGDDAEGDRVLDYCEDNGIDCTHARIVENARTGTYMALLTPEGDLEVAIGDFAVINMIDRDYLLEHEPLLADAAMVVIDTTLSEDALHTVFELAARHKVRVCADPTTPALAAKLCPYISQLYFVAPNAGETTALCGLENPAHDQDTAISAARQLVGLGAKIAVVTLAEKGLTYADSSSSGFIRAINTQVVDASGAGDALTGAVIFGLLNEVPLDEAMRLGVTAATLTLQTPETVLPNLNQELLYDKLVV